MSQRKAQQQDKFILRLPDGMRDRIRAAAEASGRSMNAEIVLTLEGAYPGNEAIDELAAEIVEKIEAFKREKSSTKRTALMEEMRDLNDVLQHELGELIYSAPTSDDDDYLKHL